MLNSYKNIILIIRDGWGINPNPEYNAVANAKTPNIDLFLKKYPHTVLESSGESVGLPPDYQGSSEVGHLKGNRNAANYRGGDNPEGRK